MALTPDGRATAAIGDSAFRTPRSIAATRPYFFGSIGDRLPHGIGVARLTDSGRAAPDAWSSLTLTCIRPNLCQNRSSLSGNAIVRDRDKGAETAAKVRTTASRDEMRARIPRQSGAIRHEPGNLCLHEMRGGLHFAILQEISVCMGMRGGAERTRTSNQAVMSRHRGLGGLELTTKRLSAGSSGY